MVPDVIFLGGRGQDREGDKKLIKLPKLHPRFNIYFFSLCLEGSAVSGSGRSGKPQAKSRDGKCSISALFFPLAVLQSSNMQSSVHLNSGSVPDIQK